MARRRGREKNYELRDLQDRYEPRQSDMWYSVQRLELANLGHNYDRYRRYPDLLRLFGLLFGCTLHVHCRTGRCISKKNMTNLFL